MTLPGALLPSTMAAGRTMAHGGVGCLDRVVYALCIHQHLSLGSGARLQELVFRRVGLQGVGGSRWPPATRMRTGIVRVLLWRFRNRFLQTRNRFVGTICESRRASWLILTLMSQRLRSCRRVRACWVR